MPKGIPAMTEETIKKAVFLYQEGTMKVTDILKETGCSPTVLYKAIHKQKVTMRYEVSEKFPYHLS